MAVRTKSAASRAVDKQLERYRSMRNFDLTREPSGKRNGQSSGKKRQGLPFVVQKHAATRLHYDFRLGWNGVLKSWAVAKGPSYFPGDKRLAVQVEDHPIEYGGFEGAIPKGQYGGGTVMIWDTGEWEPDGDVDQGLKDGHLKFALHGSKLKGGWVLVRMHGHGERPDKPNWLLIKESDSFARSKAASAITDEAPASAITDRSIEQIGDQEDHSWDSNRDPANSSAKERRKTSPGPGEGKQSDSVAVSRRPLARKTARKRRSESANTRSKSAHIKPGKTMNLPITHPDKVLDQQSGMTKQMLAEYYLAVAGHMLPLVADRPLSVVRCPEGSGKPCFFQKHVGMGVPEAVKTVSIPNRKTGKREDFLTVNSAEGLVGLAQMGVLEIHTWGSRNGSLEKPDRVVFDLDPDASIDWKTLAESAEELRARLKKLRLASFLKTTGGKGLHVVVPIEPENEWAQVKEFAHELALAMEADNPALYISKMTKAARKKKIYIDYLRNDREATAIAPYSPRARSGAPVAMTLDWKELNADHRPAFHVSDLASWRERLRHDPWKAMETTRQRLPAGAPSDNGARRKRRVG